MIYTSRYQSPAVAAFTGTRIRISVGNVRWSLPYVVHHSWRVLYPTRDMLKLPLEEYEPRYTRILEEAGLRRMRAAFAELGADQVLLCFCDLSEPGNFCHRRIFAGWWEKHTGEVVPELPADIAGATGPRQIPLLGPITG